MCVDGYWGTICHYGWDSRDADVVCRQLGFNTFGAIPRRYSHLGRGSGPVVLNLVSCNGNESNILNCRHSTIFSICSTYNLDSGVECVGMPTLFKTVTLVVHYIVLTDHYLQESQLHVARMQVTCTPFSHF